MARKSNDIPRRTYAWSDVDGGFAYVEGQVVLPVLELEVGIRAAERMRRDEPRLKNPKGVPDKRKKPRDTGSEVEASARRFVELLGGKDLVAQEVGPLHVLVAGIFDVIELVSLSRAIGVAAQPNHAFSLHGECCCGPHPAAMGWAAGSLLAGLIDASAKQAIRSGAKQAIRSGAKQAIRSGAKQAIKGGVTTAVKAKDPNQPSLPPLWKQGEQPRVVILDTGVPENPPSNPWPGLNASTPSTVISYPASGSNQPSTVLAQTKDRGDNPSLPSNPTGDDFLDEAGGHGGFIAGILTHYAPGTDVTIIRILDTSDGGLIHEAAIAAALAAAVQELPLITSQGSRHGIISMSFGGTVWTEANLLATSVASAQQSGAVVIASAGNDGTCTPQYPAALPGVLSVGAIGPDGPADFTNYGSWVRCCAPGVDIVSRFFTRDFGAAPDIGGDPDDFEGWAMWSGTSFAVPMVAAAILRDMAYNKRTAQDAVKAVIDAPHLGRIPGLGTVVNI